MSRRTVALVCPYSFSHAGGVQNHVLGLAGWLSAQGDRVAVLGPGHPSAAALRRAGLSADAVTSSGGAVPVRYNGSVARISFSPLEHLRVRAWLRRVQPDILHLHEPITPSVAVLSLWSALARPASRPATVATFHAATPGSAPMALARRALPRTIAGIDEGIAVSQVARGVVHDHLGLSPQVIGNGTLARPRPDDLDRTTWRGGTQPRITFVGRYDEPRKGFEVLEEALPLLRAHYPGADIVVVGEGTRRRVPGARFLGFVDDDERDDLLARSDVYVAPHRGRESFGIVIVEALAAGADVVASDLPAFREVLTAADGGLVGRLARVGDPVDLAAQVVQTLATHDPDRRRHGWAQAARFSWPVIGPQVDEVYVEALRRRAVRRH